MADPEILYHYTTSAGLLGILSEGKIWCTHFAYLNDSAEATYARHIFREAVKAAVDGATLAARRAVAQAVLEKLATVGRTDAKWGAVYVASFSAARDDLGQWRGYSHAGNRYAIGFDRAQLSAVALESGFSLGPLCYDLEGSVARMLPAVNSLVDSIGTVPTTGTIGWQTVVPPMYSALANDGPWLKHAKFDAEKEWRLCKQSVATGEVEFRPGRSHLTPYVPMPLQPLDGLIRELWIGPGPHPQENEDALRMLLGKLKWNPKKQPTVFRSEVPFRDW